MPMLSNKELKDYKNNGYVAPIDVLSLEEAETIRKEIEDIDEDAIQAKVKELEEAMHAISAKLYEAASAQMESEEAAEEASADGNDVVDADFEVVDDE